MKFLFWALICLTPMYGHATNLIETSFENVSDYQSWTNHSVDPSTTYSQTGTTSLQLSAVADLLITDLNLRPGHFSFYARFTNETVALEVQILDAADQVLSEFQFTDPTNSESFLLKTIDLSQYPSAKIAFSKVGGGNVYLDDFLLAGRDPVFSIEPTTHCFSRILKPNTTYSLMGLKCETEALTTLSNLSFDGQNLDQFTNYRLYQSPNYEITTESQLLADGQITELGRLNFQFDLAITEGSEVFLIVVGLSGPQTDQVTSFSMTAEGPTVSSDALNIQLKGDGNETWHGHDIQIKSAEGSYEFGLDHDFSTGLKWLQSTGFSWSTGTEVESSNLVNQAPSSLVQSLANQGNSIGLMPSAVSYGMWSFWLADGAGWSTSTQNYPYFILMSDSNDIDPSAPDYRGYYIRLDDGIELVRKTGVGDLSLAKFTDWGTDSTTINNGYQIKVERRAGGQWSVYGAKGYQSTVQLLFTITDDTYDTSVAYGPATKINSPSPERIALYADMYTEPDVVLTGPINPKWNLSPKYQVTDSGLAVSWAYDDPQLIEFEVIVQTEDGSKVIQKIEPNGDSNYLVALEDFKESQPLCLVIVHSDGARHYVPITASNSVVVTNFIKPGWNLLYTPWALKINEVEQNESLDCWLWNGSGYVHSERAILEAGTGFWIYNSGDLTQFNMHGAVEGTGIIRTNSAGWQIIGAGLDNTCLPHEAFSFETDLGTYHKIQQFEPMVPGKGYWIYFAD